RATMGWVGMVCDELFIGTGDGYLPFGYVIVFRLKLGLVLSYEMDRYRVVVGLVLSYEMEGYLVVVDLLEELEDGA
nr:hypothetical protein [Tanacetum cinerariifolium]